ncbi:hypothetical protein Dda_7913 [Drechslerella dactyloides]|uniref:Uncharacterized protein n=1 Tax=Drechslerella dactyloides TaxID=74499 RepID=A0AAD6ISB1_DREDA|nr:hypothetical protein Dda_7913 [Drechslerella dactyloides]
MVAREKVGCGKMSGGRGEYTSFRPETLHSQATAYASFEGDDDSAREMQTGNQLFSEGEMTRRPLGSGRGGLTVAALVLRIRAFAT